MVGSLGRWSRDSIIGGSNFPDRVEPRHLFYPVEGDPSLNDLKRDIAEFRDHPYFLQAGEKLGVDCLNFDIRLNPASLINSYEWSRKGSGIRLSDSLPCDTFLP